MSLFEAAKAQELVIYINGKVYHSLRKFATRDQLLKLADIDTHSSEIFLLVEQSKKLIIERDKVIELQGGMRFLIQAAGG